MSGKKYLEYLLMAIGFHILSWFFTVMVVALLAYAISDGGRPMTWFTNSWLLLPLYVVPAILFLNGFHMAAKTKVLKVNIFMVLHVALCIWKEVCLTRTFFAFQIRDSIYDCRFRHAAVG